MTRKLTQDFLSVQSLGKCEQSGVALISPSVSGSCEHIHEINANTIIKTTCPHSHASAGLLESETLPHFRIESGVACVPPG